MPKLQETPKKDSKSKQMQPKVEVEPLKPISTEDLVTITLFSLQKVNNGKSNFSQQLFAQKENIKKMAIQLAKAAREAGNAPPRFKISILLVPDWDVEGNSYQNEIYQETKERLFEKVNAEFAALSEELISNSITIEIEDFYVEAGLMEPEKRYMHQLRAIGSNADIMKSRSILNNLNCKHLQIDSNTIIKNYKALYLKTFGLPEAEQHDALNANLYAPYHVSANNKVVYIAPTGAIVPALRREYFQYMRQNMNNTADKGREANSVYEEIFTPALAKQGITYRNTEVAKHKVYYPADMTRPEYTITSEIVTAINMSWAATRTLGLDVDVLKQLEPLQFHDAAYDYQSFNYIIKKYTGFVPRNVKGGENPEFYYEKILEISDNETDIKAMQQFYQSVFSNDSQKLKAAIMKAFPEEKARALLADPYAITQFQKALAQAFPDTMKGNLLTLVLFNRTVTELHKNPSDFVMNYEYNCQGDIVQPLLLIDKLHIRDLIKPSPGFFSQKILERLTNKLGVLEGSDYDKIKQFLHAIEHGQPIEESLHEVSSLPKQGVDYLLSEVMWVLQNGNDIEGHFNYIPNRQNVEKLLHERISMKSSTNRPSAIVVQYNVDTKMHLDADILKQSARENLQPKDLPETPETPQLPKNPVAKG